MAFPVTPLDTMVELDLSGTWTDVTDHVYRRGYVALSRGRADEGARPDPASCAFVGDNRDGRWSPRNPVGAWYGSLGRNTPVRISLPQTSSYLVLPGTAGARVSTPDHASLDITGDIDIRIDASLHDWVPPGVVELASKWTDAGNQRSWRLVSSDGILFLGWTADGSTIKQLGATASLSSRVPLSRRLAVRATLDVNNGSGGHTVTYYTGPSIAGPWTQLGDAITDTGTTSIFSSSAPVEVGDLTDQTFTPPSGLVYAFELRSGIAGTVVANPDFTIQTAGATSFADGAGRTWTLTGGAVLSDRLFRFHGELSSLPARWDVTEIDAHAPVQAAGILRRLGQGASPLGSTMYRGLTAPDMDAPPVAYWPCEDEQGATSIASGLSSGLAMTINLAQPDYATFEGFACSRPLPTVQDSAWFGVVPPYTPGPDAQARFLFHIPTGVNGQRIFHVRTSGSLAEVRLFYGTGGTLTLSAYDSEGVQLATTGPFAFNIDNRLLRCSIELFQVGADVDFSITTMGAGSESLPGFASATATGRTFGRITGVGTNAGGGLTTGDNRATFGHISVHAAVTSIFDLAQELNAFAGETAGARIRRLCAEEGIAFQASGDMAVTEQMGAQLPNTLLDLLGEAADLDGGVLYEPRDILGLGYRPRVTLYHQAPAVTIDHDAFELSAPLEPTDDDADTRNDITAQRVGGSSARQVKTSGPLSVLPPPHGVGRYDEQVTLNAYLDAQLPNLAGWRLRLGTVDESRHPVIEVNRGRIVDSNPALSGQLLAFDLGDRLVVSGPPAGLPPDDISQVIQGYSETLEQYRHLFAFNCSPESPYHVGVTDDPVLGKADTDGSTLAEDLDATETAVDVATIAGAPPWTTNPAEFPFDVRVGGEVMTVTAISGASSPQTFTVVRSVNGVVKTHPTGADLRLANPVVAAL